MEEFVKLSDSKRNQYKHCLSSIQSLIIYEKDDIANMANICAVLYAQFQHHWIGFYRALNDTLVLGPFQGPLACTRIENGKGVCGTALAKSKTMVVPDVHQFPGHIACSSLSNSEIVVPVFRNNKVIAVLDVDSVDFNTFDDVDKEYLEQIVQLLGNNLDN